MKDLNDLMQAILDMDAAQRAATEQAEKDRSARLADLDAQRRRIADDAAADSKARAEAAARAAEEGNRAALEELAARRARIETELQTKAESCRDGWVDELCRRALGAAGGEG